MFKIIRKNTTGNIDYGWLKVQHHFSFGNYYDKARKGIGPLRALNNEIIMPESGYEPHKHRDLEIISYVHHGTLKHTDSLDNTVTLPAGSIQVLTTGKGVTHSEQNSGKDPLRMVNIWLDVNDFHLDPDYRSLKISPPDYTNRLTKIVSLKGADGHLHVNQNVNIFILDLEPEHYKAFELRKTTQLYLVLLEGEAYINGEQLYPKDAIHATQTIHIQPITHAHFIIVEI